MLRVNLPPNCKSQLFWMTRTWVIAIRTWPAAPLRGLYRFWQNFASRNWLSLERWHLNCDTQNTQHILQKISAKARSTEWWVYFFFKLILVTTVKHFFKNFNEFCWHYQYSDFYFETGFHKIEYIVNDLPVSIFDNCSC